ncbi:MAG: hypothetical protein HYV96_13110 [Opitutae bacterium]|nr:hypothetical protein [Opitutae bacterium]
MAHSQTDHAESSASIKEVAHRFLDETGDTTFYGSGKKLILGAHGVSLSFGMGIVRIDRPLADVRQELAALQREVEQDPLLNVLPSVERRIRSGGFFFHACKDSPDVRSVLMHYLRELPCEAEIVMGRKIPAIFERRHHGKDEEFYADMLSHLLKRRMKRERKLVLNVAERGSSTREHVLAEALWLALERAHDWGGLDAIKSHVVFNVQTPRTEPLLTVSDYLCWSVQRVFEQGETRYYDYLVDKIRLVVDLYDHSRYDGHRNYYTKKNRLTAANKLGPPFA